MVFRAILAFGVVCLCVRASAQVDLSTTVETYFVSRSADQGFAHRLSWVEMNARFNRSARATLSLTEMPNRRMLDEVYGEYEFSRGAIRAGRIRTSIGFSNWSELFYNGFNQTPIVRMLPLAKGMRLPRDEAGIETTFLGSGAQLQIGVQDSQVSSFQVLPDRLRAASWRLQLDRGDLIVGLNTIANFQRGQGIYGLDLRWSHPRIQLRSEAFTATGDDRAFGWYADIAFRLPKMSRTQLVGRTESYGVRAGTFRHQTIGIRQVLYDIMSVNLNYGWSSGYDPGSFEAVAPDGWSLQTMLRLNF